MPFRLIALGELSLYSADGGRKLAVPRKALALMAALAGAGARGVQRENVAALLWPDSEDSGRGALKQTIYELRQTLGNHSVVIGTAELALDPGELSSDVGELETAHAREQWTRVMQLYAGPFLDRFHVRGSAEFDHWVDSRRARYGDFFRNALEKSARAAGQAGDHQTATVHWRRLAAEDPLNSRVALGLINALSIVGDPAGALTHYRVHEQLLREELGTQPDAAVKSAVDRIRAGEAGSRAEAVRPPLTAGTAAALPARQAEQAAREVSAAPALPHRPLEPVRRIATRRFWIAAGLLLLTAGAVTGAWLERSPASVLESVPLPSNSSGRVMVAVHLNKIYVDGGASYDHSLAVVDGDTKEMLSLPHGAGAAVDPVTHWVWSGDYGGRFVTVRNGHTNAVIGRIPVPGCPHTFAIDGQRVWVAQHCDDHITVIDNRTRKVIRHIPIPTFSRDEVGGAKGMGEIFVNRATGIVYFWKDMIPHRLDPRSWEMRETPGMDGPILAVNEPANRLYARIDHGLQVIDGTTEKVIAHVQLPSTPARVAIGFGGRRVYVVTRKTLSTVDAATHHVLWTMPFGEGFTAHALAADDAQGRVYVLGTASDGTPSLKILRLHH